MSVRHTVICLAIFITAAAASANAQGRSDCQSPQPRSIGVALGRSSPYVELASGVVTDEADESGAVSVRSGAQLAGRTDLPVTGPLRVRLEAATSRWDVRGTSGAMTARHVVALVGVRAGRAPACAHVSAGGGVHWISFRGASIRRPAFAIAAGVEIPTGGPGAIQMDATLHVISTRDAYPIATTAVPALSLLVGWAYRF